MTTQFFEKNKKKGLLAFLLLFFNRGKGVGPLLLMVGLLAFIFILPATTFMHVPFLDRVAQALGLRSDLGGGEMRVRGGLSDSMQEGRNSKPLTDPGALFGSGGALAYYGKSTVGLVKGEGADAAKGESRQYSEIEKAGKSIGGVPTPEDADKMRDGVPLSEGELINGLMNEAYAEGMPGGGMGAFGPGLAGGPGAISRSGARAATRGDDAMASALSQTNVPAVGSSRVKGAAGGKLAWRNKRGMNSRMSGAVGGIANSNRSTAMYRLAETRAYSVAAAPPPGKCDPNNCPNEYASTASGATFDGGKPKGEIIGAPELGDPSVPSVPSEGEIGSLIDEAEQLEQDAIKCEEANDTYGPQLDRKMDEIQKLSNQLNSMDCGGGGCSASKARACQRVGDQMRVKCNEYNVIANQWANACPLTQGQSSQMNCSQ
ncbi:MAG: hypothetical protein WC728_13965 [Elusimicrobiota bacterium]